MGMAAAVVGSAVIGAGASMISSSNAANAQKDAASQANATQRQMYQQTRADLLPYNTAGQNATNALQYAMGTGANNSAYATGGDSYGSLAKPVSMTEADLINTPGYQFNLSQGLKGVQNSAAARGLGLSGAALKGAANYATGLADSTYQNQFANAVTNQTNQYNRLTGLAGLGENAAAQTGNYGTQTAANIGNNLTSAGTAQSAADIAAGRGIATAANSIGNYFGANNLLGGGMYAPQVDYMNQLNATAAGVPDLAGLY